MLGWIPCKVIGVLYCSKENVSGLDCWYHEYSHLCNYYQLACVPCLGADTWFGIQRPSKHKPYVHPERPQHLVGERTGWGEKEVAWEATPLHSENKEWRLCQRNKERKLEPQQRGGESILWDQMVKLCHQTALYKLGPFIPMIFLPTNGGINQNSFADLSQGIGTHNPADIMNLTGEGGFPRWLKTTHPTRYRQLIAWVRAGAKGKLKVPVEHLDEWQTMGMCERGGDRDRPLGSFVCLVGNKAWTELPFH